MNLVRARNSVTILALCAWSACPAVSAATVGQDPTGQASSSRGCGRVSTTTDKPAVRAELGELNRKTIALPLPTYSREARRAGIRGVVTVRIVVEANSGQVVWAGKMSGPKALRPAALAVACDARFFPAHDVDVYVGGILKYRFGMRPK